MMDTALTTYRVSYTVTNVRDSRGVRVVNADTKPVTQHVAIEEGYTTFSDIPAIIAMARGVHKNDVVIVSVELVSTF